MWYDYYLWLVSNGDPVVTQVLYVVLDCYFDDLSRDHQPGSVVEPFVVPVGVNPGQYLTHAVMLT